MNSKLKDLINSAKKGEPVYIDDAERAFEGECHRIVCTAEPAVGDPRQYDIFLPDAEENEGCTFVREYFYARVYNMISALGGKHIVFNIDAGDAFAEQLCESVADIFMVDRSKNERAGYGKCLNVTDRVNTALGFDNLSFEIRHGEPVPIRKAEESEIDAVSRFHAAVEKTRIGAYCGLDVGGTDIKVVGTKDGHICAVKEFDWNPGLLTTVDKLLYPILLLTRVICAAMAVPADAPEADLVLRREMLNKDTSVTQMENTADILEASYTPVLLDGIGISFPDVVINDRIVGGETPKTGGIREHSPDYEAEFPKMKELNTRLRSYCKPGAHIRMANDGSLAAYTAAVEWAYSDEHRGIVRDGVFAHTLGTELGTGWIDEKGEIPQIPLEIYNCLLDLGDYPARVYAAADARSTLNFNTGLCGSLQKYTSQYGAYRIAMRRFREEAPEEYEKLFSLGYLVERDGGVFVAAEPRDMRKALLEYLMTLAENGQPQAEEVFREIGRCLAVTWNITEKLLAPKVKSRVLFGRFVKKQRVFELMREGAGQRVSAPFSAADSTLAYTPIMMELDADPEHTVAQFGQAVGAVYYSV